MLPLWTKFKNFSLQNKQERVSVVIEKSKITAIAMSKQKLGWQAHWVSSTPLEDSFHQISSVEELSQKLQKYLGQLLQGKEFHNKSVAFSLADPLLDYRMLTAAGGSMSAKNREEFIHWRMAEEIFLPKEEFASQSYKVESKAGEQYFTVALKKLWQKAIQAACLEMNLYLFHLGAAAVNRGALLPVPTNNQNDQILVSINDDSWTVSAWALDQQKDSQLHLSHSRWFASDQQLEEKQEVVAKEVEKVIRELKAQNGSGGVDWSAEVFVVGPCSPTFVQELQDQTSFTTHQIQSFDAVLNPFSIPEEKLAGSLDAYLSLANL